MALERVLKIVIDIVVSYIFILSSGGFPFEVLGEHQMNIDILDKDLRGAFIREEAIKKPAKEEVALLENEARFIIEQILSILESENCFKTLTDDIDENKEVLEKWVEKTKKSQKKIGNLLKKHNNIYCVSLSIRNRRVREDKLGGLKRIPKNFKQINIMWVIRRNECLLIVFPHDTLVSFYAPSPSCRKKGCVETDITNISKYFLTKVRTGQYPNYDDKIVEEKPNDMSLFETIIANYNLVSFSGSGSKGFLISFTKKASHKSQGFGVNSIRVYSAYNYDSSIDKNPEPECPKDFYGKEFCLCATIPLEE